MYRSLNMMLCLLFALSVGAIPASAGIALYTAPIPTTDWLFVDDSVITSITLDSWTLNQKGPELLVDQIDNPTTTPISSSYTTEWDTSYSKTVNTSAYVDAAYTTELGAKFKGIGASISSKLGAGVTGSMGEQWTETLKVSKTINWGPVCCAKESLYVYSLFSTFSGSLTWYYDDAIPLHFTTETLAWTATVNQGSGKRIQLDTKYTAPPCPEPASWLLIAGGGAVLVALRRRALR